jgi:hypothetical protein
MGDMKKLKISRPGILFLRITGSGLLQDLSTSITQRCGGMSSFQGNMSALGRKLLRSETKKRSNGPSSRFTLRDGLTGRSIVISLTSSKLWDEKI